MTLHAKYFRTRMPGQFAPEIFMCACKYLNKAPMLNFMTLSDASNVHLKAQLKVLDVLENEKG